MFFKRAGMESESNFLILYQAVSGNLAPCRCLRRIKSKPGLNREKKIPVKNSMAQVIKMDARPDPKHPEWKWQEHDLSGRDSFCKNLYCWIAAKEAGCRHIAFTPIQSAIGIHTWFICK